MTTVVSPAGSESNSGMTFLMGVFLLLAIFLLLYFGIPAMRGGGGTTEGGAVNIPERMDVNVNTPQQ